MSKRESLIPKRVFRNYGPAPQTAAICVGCGASIKPGFVHTGSVIDGMAFTSIKGIEHTPVLGTIETYDKAYVIGGEEIETVKRVSFFKRKKGFLCDGCASNYHTVTDYSGRKHELVKVDAKPGFIGQSIIPVYEK